MIAPASTGRDRRRRMAVSITDHTNSGINSMVIASGRMFEIVVIKFAEPKMLLTPARWREKIPKSTAAPGCPSVDRGG